MHQGVIFDEHNPVYVFANECSNMMEPTVEVTVIVRCLVFSVSSGLNSYSQAGNVPWKNSPRSVSDCGIQGNESMLILLVDAESNTHPLDTILVHLAAL